MLHEDVNIYVESGLTSLCSFQISAAFTIIFVANIGAVITIRVARARPGGERMPLDSTSALRITFTCRGLIICYGIRCHFDVTSHRLLLK